MKSSLTLSLIFFCTSLFGQIDLRKPFENCNVSGSITILDHKNGKWITSDEKANEQEMLPASTFKIINLLIALETGVIKDENEIIKWPGSTDTTLYGYRPEIYKDMSVREAFQVSAGWAFIEIAKKIGRERYLHYLAKSEYGNNILSEKGDDFWNFGAFGISPKNQIAFLVKVHEGTAPFSQKSLRTLKEVMINEQKEEYTLRAKTGWTRVHGKDIGWWVGYVERKENTYFFATRLIKERSMLNPNFGACRKSITIDILKMLGAL
ncbi:class D beta-lactamase [Larkinella soli]|uniref:class D beta-lactamase n=1 Tax=Larkinella soli TaxID=1770527 RepID=UPI000FFBF21F|nr:class D beta-lactamase [Larkinella soli]